jgi:predicted SAM-dependent methyltransferase
MKKLEQAFKEEQGPIRLHLGCGPNVFPGYINVEGDYIANSKGEIPEGVVIHNITETYPLPDDSVDEILSVHVIEHIIPTDIPNMFAEWRRILKTSGFVAVEWPDLLKLCQYVVNNPDSLWSDNKKVLKQSVAGIFGNIGRYKDPAMLHKWGYSAESMQKLFEKHGFSRTEIQPNIHKKSLADSRVVAWK